MSQFNSFENAIDFSFWKDLCVACGKRRRFARGEYFAHEGTVLNQVGWIISGAFKHALLDDEGNEKVVGFVFAESPLANYEGTVMSKPIRTDIIAMEESDALMIPTSLVKERLESDPAFNLQLTQALFVQAYSHTLSLYRHTPEERYRALLDRYPRIFKLVSQGEIASYLNISRRQLYRIRQAVNR